MLTAGAMLAMAIHNKVSLQRPSKSVLQTLMRATEACSTMKNRPILITSRHTGTVQADEYLGMLLLGNGKSDRWAVSCSYKKAEEGRQELCTMFLLNVQVSPRLVGLALGQVLNLSGTMQWCALVYSQPRQQKQNPCPAQLPWGQMLSSHSSQQEQL